MDQATVVPIALLAFGAIALLMQAVVLYRKGQGFGPQAVRIMGLTIILTLAAALTASSIQIERLTAVIGFMATIAGYLAGRTESKSEG